MVIKQIKTEDEYRAVLKEINRFFENEPEPGTPEAEEFDQMVRLIESYEAKHFPITYTR